MFVPCTALLYDSTAATRTLKLSTTPLSISCRIHLVSLLMMSSLVFGLFSQTLSFRYLPQKIVRPVEILGIEWPGVIGLTQNESVQWEVMPEIFCERGTWKTVCENNPQTREDIIRREIRWIPLEMLNGVVNNFNFRVTAVLSYSSVVHGTNIALTTEKV